MRRKRNEMNPSQDWLADKWLEAIALLARSSYFRPHVSPPISRPKRPTAAMRCKRVKQERDRKRKNTLKGCRDLEKEKMSESALRIKAWFREQK